MKKFLSIFLFVLTTSIHAHDVAVANSGSADESNQIVLRAGTEVPVQIISPIKAADVKKERENGTQESLDDERYTYENIGSESINSFRFIEKHGMFCSDDSGNLTDLRIWLDCMEFKDRTAAVVLRLQFSEIEDVPTNDIPLIVEYLQEKQVGGKVVEGLCKLLLSNDSIKVFKVGVERYNANGFMINMLFSPNTDFFNDLRKYNIEAVAVALNDKKIIAYRNTPFHQSAKIIDSMYRSFLRMR